MEELVSAYRTQAAGRNRSVEGCEIRGGGGEHMSLIPREANRHKNFRSRVMLRNNHLKHASDGPRACEKVTRCTDNVYKVQHNATSIAHECPPSCFPLVDRNSLVRVQPSRSKERTVPHSRTLQDTVLARGALAYPWSPRNEEHGRERANPIGHGGN